METDALQRSVEGVSREAVAASFDPANNKSLVNTGDQPMNTLSKKTSHPIITNKDGDCIIAIQPCNIFSAL